MAQSSTPGGGSAWTVGRKVALGFDLSFALLLSIGGIGHRSIDNLALPANFAELRRLLSDNPPPAARLSQLEAVSQTSPRAR